MNKIIGVWIKAIEVFGWLLCGYHIAINKHLLALVFGFLALVSEIIVFNTLSQKTK